MQQRVKNAVSSTTCHGLPRLVSSKPIYVRIAWLLLYLLMLSLFLKGFFEFVNKLQAKKVTASVESNEETFRFPDVYACFENPISGSYSTNLDLSAALSINASFKAVDEELRAVARKQNKTQEETRELMIEKSFTYVFGLPYKLLFDALAHRAEQSVVSSSIIYIREDGEPAFAALESQTFNHPLYLRCLRWTINDTWQEKMITAESWAGLTVTLLLDTNASFMKQRGHQVSQRTFLLDGTEVPVFDWTMSIEGFREADRPAGLKVFLSPPGVYPSDFVGSFSLAPGKYHTVEIGMTRNLLTENQLPCIGSHPAVQFTNPYDLSPYSHAYSYSYCFYEMYHRLNQQLFNLSGHISPLPWPLRIRKYLFNITGSPHYGSADYDPSVWNEQKKLAEKVRTACAPKRPCSTMDYSTSISSAAWPTSSSLAPFVNSSVRQAWMQAKARNLSVPVLDFLMTGNASSVASYVQSNLLKVRFKPRSISSDKITFSIDYGVWNFVSEVGGIMGIYLGMSLLTLCELLELLYDVTAWYCSKREDDK